MSFPFIGRTRQSWHGSRSRAFGSRAVARVVHEERASRSYALPRFRIALFAIVATSPLLSAQGVSSAAVSDRHTARPHRTADSLTLRVLFDAVDRANPRARAALLLARAAEARVAGTTRPPDPELQLGLMNYSLPRLAPDAALGMRQLQLMQMVPLPGKLAAAGDAARARADAARLRADDTRWDGRTQAAMSFYDAWAAAERARLARETRRLLEQIAAVANAMYKVGDGRQGDVLRARVAIATMDEDVARMEAMQEAMRGRLVALTDLSRDALAAPFAEPTLPDAIPSLDAMLQLADAGRPMLAAGAADVRAASANTRLARRERWPDVKLGLQYGERSMDGGTDRMGSVMIGASLPVFARDRQLRMRDEAAAMQAMAQADLDAMRAETRARVIERHAELASARRLLALYRQSIIHQAEAAAESALASYRSGAVDFMTVLDNRMTVNRYLAEVATLRANEGKAWAELEMLAGRPLTDTAPLPPIREGARQ